MGPCKLKVHQRRTGRLMLTSNRPLSDGNHMLFTDPTTGHLFLGSDAPAGGPTKLLRKVRFIPPDTPSARAHEACEPPLVYAAGISLEWGVRIAALYGAHLVFFTVPGDVLDDVKRINGSSIIEPDDGDTQGFGGRWREW